MAKALKYHYEFYDDINEVLKRVEIWVEGFVGDSTELKAGSTPLRRTYNKDVGEKYLGGVVQTSVNIEAGSTDSFQAIEISSPNYGDVIIKHKIGSTVLFNAIVVPFEGSDIDLPSTYYNVSLGAECGLNKLASITYSHSGTRKKIIQVIKECLAELPYIDTFPIKVIDSTQVYGTEVLVGTDYWDTYIDDLNFKDDSCLTVIKKLIQVYNEIVFSDGAWYIRNIKEISTQDSDIHTFAWADLAKTTVSYGRTTTSVARRAGGSFGKLFSQQNIKITKGQSKLRNTFTEGDDLTGTGWTYSGGASLVFDFENGQLGNSRATVYTPTFVGADNTYVESPFTTFYPFQEFFSTKEKERLIIKGLATKGNYIKHLRFQIRASSGGINHYLTTEGTWYTEVSGLPTPIYEKTYSGDQEFNIDIPQPPYVTAGMLSSADRINIGEFGYFNGTDFTLPDTNLAYNIYIRVYLPERTWDDPSMTGDEDYGKQLEVFIEYLRIEKADISGVVQNGFSRNYGVAETKDRKIDFSVDLGVGYPSYPSGLDCLFLASSGESQGLSYGELNSLTSFEIDEFIAESYLNVLANQLKFYQGTVEADLEFTDIVEIDEIKYRIHNLEHDSRRNTSVVKLVELNSVDNVVDITTDITLSDDVIRNIDEQITKTLGSNLPIRYVDINFKETTLPTGERVIGLRDDFRKTSIYTEDAFLKASSNGLTKVITADTEDDFTWTVPAEEANRTFASREYLTDTAWLLNGNALIAAKSIGSTTAFDVTLIRNSSTIATLKSTGLHVNNLGTNYLPKHTTGGLADSLAFDNGTNFTIGTNTDIDSYSRLYIFGGTNGANVDARPGGGGYDQSIFDAQGSDYATNFNSVHLRYQGVGAVGTTLGYSNVNLADLTYNYTSGDRAFLIRSVGTSPIVISVDTIEKAKFGATTTDFDAVTYNFKNGGTTYAKIELGSVKFGSGISGNPYSVQILTEGTSPIINRLAFGTDGTGYSFAFSKNQGGTVSDLALLNDSGSIIFDVNGGINADNFYYLNNGSILGRSGNYTTFIDGNARSGIYLGNSTDPSNYYDNGTHYFRNRDASTTYATLNSTGLGIGTTSPSVKTEISSTDNNVALRVDSNNGGVSSSNYSEIQLSDNGAVRSYWRNVRDGSGKVIFRYSDHLAFLNGSDVEKVRFTSDGNVGIGSSNPDVLSRGYSGRILGVSSSGQSNISINSATGNGAYFDMGINNVRTFGIYTDANESSLNTVGNTPLYFATNSSVRLTVLGSGNVGINTTSPSELLHVNGTSRTTNLKVYGNDALNWVAGGTTTAASVFGDTSGTGSSIFINTASLNSAFHSGLGVDGTYTSQKSIINLKAFGVKSAGGYNSEMAFYTSLDDALYERVRITSVGLGIGTTTPSYKLDVTGTGHFTGSVTFDTVPSSLQDATTANHLVRYSQWIASTSIKYLPTPVLTVSLTNITLLGVQTINGVMLIAGDRVLVMGQTVQADNGIYIVAAGVWVRATDSDSDTELRGYIINVSSGTYAGYKYINTNESTITVGTTAITYAEFSGIAEIDPVFVSWRDTTRTANTFWAAPNGSNGVATWRALVASDVPTLNQSTTGSAATLTTTRNIAITGDIAWNVDFNGSGNVTAAGTLATVNSNVGTFRSVTVNAKGLVTAATNPAIALGSEVSGILPISNGGTGSATQNFVDLTNTQTIGGIKTFSAALTAQSLTSSGGIITVGNFTAFGITYNTLDSSIIQSGQQLYFAFKPLIQRASQFVFDRGFVKIGGNTSGLPADIDFATERLDIDGNIRYSGLLKPSNTAGTTGQVLSTDGTNDAWTTLTVSHISNIASTYQPLDATLTALAGLNTTAGVVIQTGTDTFTKRTLTGTADRLTITNGDGVSGNPTFDISTSYVGQSTITTLGTITTGVWNGSVIPIAYGGTGSSTQNFVDLTTTQSSIAGQKTFVAPLSITPDGTGTSVIITSYTNNSVKIPRINASVGGAGNATSALSFYASSYLFKGGSLRLSGTTGSGGSIASIDAPTERLDVDGNIRYTTLLKPNNVAGTNGQVLGTNGTQDAWVTLGISSITGLQTALDGKQATLPSGTAGQFFVRDSTGALNFMDLKIKPIGLSSERIGVGNVDNFLGEQPFFLFKDKRYIQISRITDSAKQFNIGFLKKSNNAFIEHIGGTLSIKASDGIYLSDFASPSRPLSMVTIDSLGKLSVSSISGGGATQASLTTNHVGVGVNNVLSSSSNFTYLSDRYLHFTGSSANVNIGATSSGTAGFMESVNGNLLLQARSTFGVIVDDGFFQVNDLAGTGDRMVVVNSTGVLSTQAIPSGGGTPTLTATQIGFGSGSNLLSGSANFTFENDKELIIRNGGTSSLKIARFGIDNYQIVAPDLSIALTNAFDVTCNGLNLFNSGITTILGDEVKIGTNAENTKNEIGLANTGNQIILSGTSFKLNLSDAWGGSYTPSNGDKCVITYDSSKSSFVIQKMNTYNDGTRTYLIL